MEVARTFLAQHHSQEDDADFPELSEGEDDSTQGKKRPEMAVPHVSVRRSASPRDDQPEECSTMLSSRLHRENPSTLCDLQGVLVLANCAQLLRSISHIDVDVLLI